MSKSCLTSQPAYLLALARSRLPALFVAHSASFRFIYIYILFPDYMYRPRRRWLNKHNTIEKKTWYVERATIWSAHMWSCEYDDALYLLGNHQPVGRQTNVLAAIQQRKSWMGAWSLAFAMQHYLNQNISPHWQTPTEPRYDRLTEYVCHMWVIW